jgi:hypothetical protein
MKSNVSQPICRDSFTDLLVYNETLKILQFARKKFQKFPLQNLDFLVCCEPKKVENH